MKRLTKIIFIIIALSLMTSCQDTQEEVIIKEKPVKTMILKAEQRDNVIQYKGTVVPEDILKKSFVSGGTIQTISVEKGDKVEIGQSLASLNAEKADIAVSSSSSQASAAYQDYQKALDQVNYLRKQYADTETLFNAGAVSKQQVDDLKLKLDLAEKSLAQAQSVYYSAAEQTRYNKTLQSDSDIFSDINGYVVEVMYKEGELAPPGYPVVVIRTEELKVKIALSSDDKNRIGVGDPAFLIIDGIKIKSRVTSINSVPDQDTNTYEAELSVLEPDKFNIGDLIETGIITGSAKGIWVNINYILSDGFDYVYVVKDGRAFKKNVEIQSIVGDKALVNGLDDGDELIVAGYASVSDGYKIKIVNDEDSEDSKEKNDDKKSGDSDDE